MSVYPGMMILMEKATPLSIRSVICKTALMNMVSPTANIIRMMDGAAETLLGLDSDTFYIYHVAAVMVDNLRRLLLGINLSDKAVMDFDFPGVGFPV